MEQEKTDDASGTPLMLHYMQLLQGQREEVEPPKERLKGSRDIRVCFQFPNPSCSGH